MLCHSALKIFVTNVSPGKIQVPGLQNETQEMDMVGWWFTSVNPGAT